jgi:hypothetical protein
MHLKCVVELKKWKEERNTFMNFDEIGNEVDSSSNDRDLED